MSAFLTATLSLVPGLGHWVVGKRGKAVALFTVDVGLVCSTFFLKSIAGYLLILLGYLITMVPAVIEIYAFSQGKVSRFSESKPYILVMLLTEGFTALPLLWQSPVFSKRTKIAWSIVVPVLALLYFWLFFFFGMRFLNHIRF